MGELVCPAVGVSDVQMNQTQLNKLTELVFFCSKRWSFGLILASFRQRSIEYEMLPWNRFTFLKTKVCNFPATFHPANCNRLIRTHPSNGMQSLLFINDFAQIPLEDTPDLPKPLQREKFLWLNCWWRVRGIFQGHVGEIIDIIFPNLPLKHHKKTGQHSQHTSS